MARLVQDLHAIQKDNRLKLGTEPVGGRLSSFADRWSSQFYKSLLSEGFKIQWSHLPPQDFDMGVFVPESKEEEALVALELESLQLKRAVEVADSPGGHIYRWFLVSKKGTTAKRPVLNMKPGNTYVK